MQIGQTNPALLQLITENQESFLNMLNEPNADELNVDVANSGSGGGTVGSGGTAAPTGAVAGDRPSDATLVLTAQDRDAIERVSVISSIILKINNKNIKNNNEKHTHTNRRNI